MAQYIAFDKNVEVNGETVATIINAFPEYLTEFAIKILKNHGIENPTPGEWYSQDNWLAAFADVSQKFGVNTLFEIGKAIPANANFPENIETLEQALESIDKAYHMNHRNGEIGFYKLVEFNDCDKSAIMHCKNPYPCEFDRGIITAIARRFRPPRSNFPQTKLIDSKPGRQQGADESWYKVTW